MANKTIRMTIVRQIIRLRAERYSQRAITRYLGIARNTIGKYMGLIQASGLDYPELLALSDEDLDELFTPEPKGPVKQGGFEILESRFLYFEAELKKVGVTKLMLWSEYKTENPDGYGYSQFNHYFKKWLKQKDVTMHFEHKAGDKVFVDFTGKKMEIVDRDTGEVKKVEVFIAILGASQLTYVQATYNQRKEYFLGASENAFIYFGGVPRAIVPDNLKPGVTKSDRYEPEVNETFLDFAMHYGTTVLPTRAVKPRDKALVENAVTIVYRRIFAPLRKQVFHSLEELNQAIRIKLNAHNDTAFQKKEQSRREVFDQIEKDVLHPLPDNRYEFKQFKILTVQKNSHIYLHDDKHYYSVPYKYTGEKVKVAYSSSVVEIYHNNTRIAFHGRDRSLHRYTTVKDHMPSAHQFVSDWSAEKFISWAESIGKSTELLIRAILDTKSHPEQAYKSCVGILSYGKKVGYIRLENACQRALEFNAHNYKTVKRILDNGLESIDLNEPQYNLPFHQNIRGSNYYDY